MLFTKKLGARVQRRRRGLNRHTAYTLNLRGRSVKRLQNGLTARITLILLCAGIVMLIFWLMIWVIGGLFSRNSMYEIVNLDIDTRNRIVSEYIHKELQIHPGKNLFGFDIQKEHARFVKFAPHYRSVEITRILPGTLKFSIIEREPVAQIGDGGGYGVDIEKHVFNNRNRDQFLPVILGYQDIALKPGVLLSGLAADAITVIAVLAEVDPSGVVVVEGIDISNRKAARPGSLRLYLKHDIIVDLWWKQMKGNTRHDDLRKRLADLVEIVARSSERGRKIKVVKLITDDYTKNSVTYWK